MTVKLDTFVPGSGILRLLAPSHFAPAKTVIGVNWGDGVVAVVAVIESVILLQKGDEFRAPPEQVPPGASGNVRVNFTALQFVNGEAQIAISCTAI